jgi:gliding motility-associated-like protein
LMKSFVAYVCLFFLFIATNGYSQNLHFSGGDRSSVLLCKDGHVYVSGANDLGQLGRGLLSGINSPDIVSGIGAFGTLTYIKQVSGKQDLSLIALSSTGDSVITWGNNSRGQLGNNLYGNALTNNNRYPYRVVGVNTVGYLTGVKYVTTGVDNAYAILNNGKVVSWGNGSFGALGNGTNSPDMTSPVYVIKAVGDTLKNAISIVAGAQFAIALLSDGTLWGWGQNNIGQLAQGTNVASIYAVQIKGKNGIGFLNNIISISCSETHVLALSSTDTTWAWGDNISGQLGNNSNTTSFTPVAVLNSTATAAMRNVRAIATGQGFSMALRVDSTISVWGTNANGQFGNNSTVSSLVPTKVLDEFGTAPLKNIVQISSGKRFAFAQRVNGMLWAWGDNTSGQLAVGDNVDRHLPDTVTMPCTWVYPPTFVKGTISGPANVCAPVNSGTITLTGQSGSIVAWQKSTNNFASYVATSSSSSSFGFSNLTQKTSFRAVILFNDQLSFSDSLVVSVDQASFGGTPGPPATVCSGTNTGTINLIGGYIGTILNWESSLDSFATAGNPIVNNLSSYIFNNLSSTTYYRAIVKNGSCLSANSSVVKITVDPATAGGSLAGSATVCSGTNSGNMTLSGQTGSIVRWESSIDNFSTVNVISSTATLQAYLNLTTTTKYRVQLKSGVCPAVYSTVATIAVDNLSVPGVLNSSATVCSGSNSNTITLTGYTGAISGWESSTDNFTTVVPIANTTNMQGYTNLTSSTAYRVTVQNGVCPSVLSNIVLITVDIPTVGGTVTAPATVCFGTNSGSMTLTGNTGVIQRWEYSSDNFSFFINPIVNSTTSQNFSNLTVTTYYRAVIKNGVCNTEYSTTNIITVDPLSSGGSIASPAVVCSGANSGLLTLGANVGNVLEWEISTDNFITILPSLVNTTLNQNYSNLTTTTYYRVKIQSGVCPMVYSSPVTITVIPVSVGGTVNTSTTVCSGSSGNLFLVGNTGSILRWEYSTDNFVADINVLANVTGTQAYSNILATTQYRARVKNGVCSGIYSSIAVVTVDQPSSAGTVSASSTVCSGSSGSLTLGGTIVGSIVQWESSSDNFSTIINPIANTTNTLNYTNITSTTSYRVQVKNGVCTQTSSNIVLITVDALSNGGIVASSTNECSGTNSGTLNLSGKNGNVLRWESSTDGFVTPVTISNIGITQSYLNLTSTTQYRAVVKNGVCPPAFSITPATITIYPVSVGGTVSAPDTVCSGFNNGTLLLAGNTGNVIRWETSNDNFATAGSNVVNTGLSQNYLNLINTTYYRALVQNGTCATQYSSVVRITVNPLSAGGTITGHDTVCISSNGGKLKLSGYLGTVIQWETSTDNFATVVNPVTNITDSILYSNLTTTTYFRAQIQSIGCPVVYPSPVAIQVDSLSVGGTLTAPAVVCANANSGSINVVGKVGSVIRWEASLDNFITDITPVANTTTIENYLNLDTTTYYRTVVKSGVCPLDYSNITAVTVNPASKGGTILGTPNICVDGNIGSLALFNSSNPPYIVQWETSTDNFNTSSVYPNTTIYFNYNNITVPTSVRAMVQVAPCPAVFSTTFNFIINPSTAGGYISGNNIVKKGTSDALELRNFIGAVVQWEYTADTSSTWQIIAVPSNLYVFTNIDTSIYVRVKVRSGNCPDKYSKIFHIKISSEIDNEVKVYPTISPNSDNINDEWIIDNISLNPGNHVRIYNRWGEMVYEQRGYDNINNVWRGQSNVHYTVTGRDLPEGTYFYQVDLGNGKPELSGYVVLNR